MNSVEYLVSYGRSGGLGRFIAEPAPQFRRGQRVVVNSVRGAEIGAVLCLATAAHARLLQTPATGQVLRLATAADFAADAEVRTLEQRVFDRSRCLAVTSGLPMEILDIEIPLECRQAILQILSSAVCDPTDLVECLEREFDLDVRLEDLATPRIEEDEHGGCGEPNCGRENGGCTSCSSANGGCATGCGSKAFDIRQYFGHLREQMEVKGRVTIL